MATTQLKWKSAELSHVRGRGTWTIQPHTGRDNLMSSWTLAANLYFPFGERDALRLIADFLAVAVDTAIAAVSAVELEWEHADPRLRPPALLGEVGGGRGSNQTSPDLAFEVTLADGRRGVVLTEVKFMEHNFYACSARKKLDETQRAASCDTPSALRRDPRGLCAQHSEKGRRYWDYLHAALDWGVPLQRCPAATAGYQLFRQQALAEALAADPALALVLSTVAYDERNAALLRSLRNTGRVGASDSLRNVSADWAKLFNGRAGFKAFTHQSWVSFVRTAPDRPAWCEDWVDYVTRRYGL